MFIGPNHRSFQSLPKQNIVDKLGTALGLFSQDWVVFMAYRTRPRPMLALSIYTNPPVVGDRST